MFPWLWIWAPRVDFPLSGNVTQDIEPEWFFSAIKPSAGHASVEKDIFMHSSYGKQLGLMMDVLLPLAEGKSIDSKKLSEATERLQQLQSEIDGIKLTHQSITDEALDKTKVVLSELQLQQPELLKALIAPYIDPQKN